jgi:hypothetical protein
MLSRRSALLLPFLALGCAREDPVINLPDTPIGFRHLLPLRLNVAEISIPEANLPAGPTDFGAELPLPPPAAVRQMARDRLFAVGSAGQAIFGVTQAAVLRQRGAVACLLGCRLDVISALGGRLGFIEASARASMTLPDDVSPTTLRRAGEAVLRDALGKLNVEFEFQARRNLRAWLMESPAGTGTGAGLPAPAPGEVEREDLARPQ